MERREHEPVIDYTTYLVAYERAVKRFQERPTPTTLALLDTGEQILIRELLKPGRFELGQMVATPGAMETMQRGLHIPPEFLLRHKRGDFGQVDEFDRQANEQAVTDGTRILSSYQTRTKEGIWVITEADRSSTTILLPEEY